MARLRTTALLLLALVPAACGGSDDVQDTAAPPPAASPSGPSDGEEGQCELVPQEFLGRITHGARPEVGTLTVAHGYAVRTGALHLVAAQVVVPDVQGAVAVWATDALDGTAGFASIDDTARALTTCAATRCEPGPVRIV